MKIIKDKREVNWGVIGLLLCTALIWYCIFTIGLISTLTWIVIIASICGITIKVKDETRV